MIFQCDFNTIKYVCLIVSSTNSQMTGECVSSESSKIEYQKQYQGKTLQPTL